jgi:hypothetical protein
MTAVNCVQLLLLLLLLSVVVPCQLWDVMAGPCKHCEAKCHKP